MDRSDHHPVLLLRLRRREQLGLGRRKLGRLRRLQQQRMRLWLRLRWMQRRMRVQLQLQLRMQRLLLLSSPAGRDASRPAFAVLQRDRRSRTMARTSWWMSSGVRGTPSLAQLTTVQPWARAISPAHSRQRRR